MNCTTNIYTEGKIANPLLAFDWRMLANGYLDQFLYERNPTENKPSFVEWKEAAHINARAQAADSDQTFSRKIRE